MEKRVGALFGETVLGMAVAVGTKLGAFKAIQTLPERWTDVQLAEATGCKLRYITEWLAAMVCGDIIKLDTTKETDMYYMPADDSDVMTQTGDGYFLLLDTFAHRYPMLSECFKMEGPRGYVTDYMEHAMIAADGFRIQRCIVEFRDYILPKMPILLKKLASGIKVADVGCGTGTLAHYVAMTFPNSEVHGLDLFDQPLIHARSRAQSHKLSNLKYDLFDIMKPKDNCVEKFDLIIASVLIHDLPFPEQALRNINDILKDDGVFLLIETNQPSGLRNQLKKTPPPFLQYALSLFECLPISLNTPGSAGMGLCPGADTLIECANHANFKCDQSFPAGDDENAWHACHVCRKI